MGAKIDFIEFQLPNQILHNQEVIKNESNYNIEKFEKKVGIYKRHVADINESALDIAFGAIDKLLFKHPSLRKEIDFIIYCTQSPDYILPTNACLIQDKFELSRSIGAFDINLGCSGYTYGLMVAKAFIESKQATKVLLVTSDTYSKYIHKEDYSNRLIFGDAATATIISESKENAIFDFITGTDGSGYDHLIIKEKVFDKYSSKQHEIKQYGANKYTDAHLYMNGPEIFNFTLKEIPKLTTDALRKNKFELNQIDYFIFHQANSFLINTLRKSIGIPKEKFFNDIQETGNTVSSTIPIALKKYSQKKLLKDELILLNGYGVGLSMCAGIIKLSHSL